MQIRQEINDKLSIAVIEKDVTKISELLTQGADVNTSSNNGTTLLHLAVMLGHTEVIKTLCDKGANTELKDLGGYTSLHLAVKLHHWSLVPLLLHYGADFNCTTTNNNETLYQTYRRHYARSFVQLNDGKLFYPNPCNPEKDAIEFSMIRALMRAGMQFKPEFDTPVVTKAIEAMKEDASLRLKARTLGQGMRQEGGFFQRIPQEICSHIIDLVSNFSTKETEETIRDSFTKP